MSGVIDALWGTQGGACFHCGQPMLRIGQSNHDHLMTREHLFPRKIYVTKNRDTCIVLAHRHCNADRGCRSPSPSEVARAKSIYAVAELPWHQPKPRVLLAIAVSVGAGGGP